MDETIERVAVLYADVSGSTRLYEKFGDKIARADVDQCVKILSEVAVDNEGETAKTIGDEVMCIFVNPVNAAQAACDMQQAMKEASNEDRFQSGSLHIKIGWHYGSIHCRGNEILGEAPITAQQVIRLAKADEILTTGKSLATLPECMKDEANMVDQEKAEAWEGEVDIYSMPWEDADDVTALTVAEEKDDPKKHCSLTLEYDGHEYTFDDSRPVYTVGRGEDNDISVHGKFTSRHHAEIQYRHGRFHLQDFSTNGTSHIEKDKQLSRIHRENIILNGTGLICFGGTPDEDPSGTVSYSCH